MVKDFLNIDGFLFFLRSQNSVDVSYPNIITLVCSTCSIPIFLVFNRGYARQSRIISYCVVKKKNYQTSLKLIFEYSLQFGQMSSPY
jgi:hypothetical protein